MKKHVNPKDFLHQVYTNEGGVREHNKNQRVIGALALAATVLILQKIGRVVDAISDQPIKATKER